MALERRLAAGLGAKAELTVRRWLSKIATELQDSSTLRCLPFGAGLPRR
jgi:hypothetical protein